MADKKFRKSVYAALILIIVECFLLFGRSYSQQVQTAPVAGSVQQENTVSTLISTEQIQRALNRCKGRKLVISIYPVKESRDPKQNDIKLQLVYQCEGEKFSSRNMPVNLRMLKLKSANYIRYLRYNQVKKENIPQCYYVVIDPDEAKSLLGVAVSINLLQSDIRASNVLPCNPLQQSTEKCDCTTHPFYFAMSTIPPGKCPPCLSTRIAPANNTVQGAIDNVYGSKENY